MYKIITTKNILITNDYTLYHCNIHCNNNNGDVEFPVIYSSCTEELVSVKKKPM